MSDTEHDARPAWLRQPVRMLINGAPVAAIDGATVVDPDPSSGRPLAEVPDGGPGDVDAAVAAARRALREGPWQRLTPDARGRLLWRLAEQIERHADELALLDALDSGRPLLAARRVDLPLAAQLARYWAGWPTRIEGATVPLSAPGRFHAFTRHEPVGVVGVILPWNAPALFVAWKAFAALACGNAVVVRPAEETPLSALRIAALALKAGLPPGALNVVVGGARVGAALAAHPDVDRIAFTGSVATGREVVRAALGDLKRVSLELGGKSPNVVCADADLGQAIPGAAHAAFFNQGCVCAAGSRLFVHASVFDEVVAGVSAHAARIRLGPPLDPGTRMGPLISPRHRERVAGIVESALAAGARATTGGRRRAGAGCFYEPTVVVAADPSLDVVREEVFGPVVVVTPFERLEDAVAQANDSAYGLAAGVWTRDLGTAHALGEALVAGTVWVNAYNVVDPVLPFGGARRSGWGRDLGREALDLYTETKAVCIALPQEAARLTGSAGAPAP